jgi:phosphate uptake regulator
VYKNFLRGRIPLYLHPQPTPQEVKDAAREEVHNVRKANIDCVDHFNAAMQDLAAQQLVIQQMRTCIDEIGIFNSKDHISPEITKICRSALAIQPSTEALDAYVAEKVKEARAQALFDAADDFEAGASADDIRSNAAAIRARSDKENGE